MHFWRRRSRSPLTWASKFAMHLFLVEKSLSPKQENITIAGSGCNYAASCTGKTMPSPPQKVLTMPPKMYTRQTDTRQQLSDDGFKVEYVLVSPCWFYANVTECGLFTITGFPLSSRYIGIGKWNNNNNGQWRALKKEKGNGVEQQPIFSFKNHNKNGRRAVENY